VVVRGGKEQELTTNRGYGYGILPTFASYCILLISLYRDCDSTELDNEAGGVFIKRTVQALD